MLVKWVGFPGVVSHGVFGAHAHEFLGFVEVAALLSKSIETVLRWNLAGVNPAVVAVLHIGQVHDIGMKQGSLFVIHADAKRVLLHHYLQITSLDYCLPVPVRQDCVCRFHPSSAAFQEIIHPVFPCCHHKAVGFLREIAVKSGPDTQDGICQKKNADFHTVCHYWKVIILFGDRVSIRTNLHNLLPPCFISTGFMLLSYRIKAA